MITYLPEIFVPLMGLITPVVAMVLMFLYLEGQADRKAIAPAIVPLSDSTDQENIELFREDKTRLKPVKHSSKTDLGRPDALTTGVRQPELRDPAPIISQLATKSFLINKQGSFPSIVINLETLSAEPIPAEFSIAGLEQGVKQDVILTDEKPDSLAPQNLKQPDVSITSQNLTSQNLTSQNLTSQNLTSQHTVYPRTTLQPETKPIETSASAIDRVNLSTTETKDTIAAPSCYFWICSRLQGFVLQVDDTNHDGAYSVGYPIKVMPLQKNLPNHQLWRFEAGYMISKVQDYVLDCLAIGSNNSTLQLIIAPKQHPPVFSQQWTIEDGYLTCTQNAWVADIPLAWKQAGTRVILFPKLRYAQPNQQWDLKSYA